MHSVLTINVPYFQNNAIPYGPAVVNGILSSAGYQVLFWDANIELYHQFKDDENYNRLIQSLSYGGANHFRKIKSSFFRKINYFMRQSLLKIVNGKQPEIIALSIFSNWNVDFISILLPLLKKEFPESYIIAGGRGLDNIEKRTFLSYGEFLVRYSELDCAYLGDAENDLISVLEKRIRGVVYANPVNEEELKATPDANWTGYNFSLYEDNENDELYVPITASKGCVKQCSFCDVKYSWPKYIFRNGEEVGNEIIDIYKQFNRAHIEFTDNLVNGSITNFRLMNQTIADKLPNTIKYKGYAICRGEKGGHPESDFELAKRAGAHLFKIGLESGSEKVRFDMKKKFTNDDFDWFAKNCFKYNIRQIWLMFVGYPTESEEDFKQTLELIKNYSYMNKTVEISPSMPMMLTNGSNMFQNHVELEKFGLSHNHDSMSVNFWTSTVYTENTWPVRHQRAKIFFDLIYELGFITNRRYQLKCHELDGLNSLYENYKPKNISIPITIRNSI